MTGANAHHHLRKDLCCTVSKRDQKLEAMDDKCRLKLLPVDLQLTVLGKLGWTELATLACASKHFLGLVRHCGCLLGLGLALIT